MDFFALSIVFLFDNQARRCYSKNEVICVKKITAVLLAAILLCIPAVFPAAAEETPAEEPAAAGCDCGNSPVILINGINARDLLLTDETGAQTVTFPFANEDIPALIKENKKALWDMLDGRFSDESAAAVEQAVEGLLAGVVMNDDGTSRYDVRIDWEYPMWDGHKQGQGFTFCYDWRLDPFEIADGLHDFIQYVQTLTGHDSVSLVGFSEGALMLNTYLCVYGYENIDACVWYCGAHNGVEIVGQLFTGRYNLDAAAVTDYVHAFTEQTFAMEALSFALEGLRDIGVTRAALKITNKVLSKLNDMGTLQEITRETFGKMPAIWAMVGDEYYEEAKAYIFGDDLTSGRYDALLEKIDRYHNEVQAHSAEIMQTAAEQIGKVGVISKYGTRMIPVTENATVQADGVIHSAGTSCGAVFAPFGTTLGKTYLQAVSDGHDHLSADGMVDASAALFPENTWFIKNLEHSQSNVYINDLLRRIVTADAPLTVSDDPAFPQFAVYNAEEDSVSPLTADNADPAPKKAVVRIREFFQKIRDWFLHLFDWMKK